MAETRTERPRRMTRRRPARRIQRVRRMRISLRVMGMDHRKIENFSNAIVEALKSRGAKVSGPIRLPTRRMNLSVRKSPCGEGTPTYDFYILNIHKRLIIAELSSKDLVYLVSVPVPPNMWTEIRIS
ncbi:MAG: 30S ribosomal protein S10 [Candidatus Njordarchaeia archaeon]|nr:30S ribosomal protein S10 [Candidatus Korarchaeota archaeon]